MAIHLSTHEAHPQQTGAVGGRRYAIRRWMYRGNRPSRLAKAMNRMSAVQFSAGLLSPRRAVTLEVRGRRTGRTISFPLVVADFEGERYLVSMLGEQANWVHNVRAADGRAVLRRGGRTPIWLAEVEPGRRAPILRRYLELAPGARPHIPVDRHAPVAAFERVAAAYPVFRIVDRDAEVSMGTAEERRAGGTTTPAG